METPETQAAPDSTFVPMPGPDEPRSIAPDDARPDPPQRKLTAWDHLLMNGFWFGFNFMWGGLLTLALPGHMQLFDPVDYKRNLGLLEACGALFAVVIPLFIGPLSDRCRSRFGRRRPYMAAGAVIAAGGLAVMLGALAARSLPIYFLGFFLLQIGANTALGSYSGVIPDLVPKSERGLGSGVMAMMTQSGTLLGLLVAFPLAFKPNLYFEIVIGVLLFFTAVSWAGMKETRLVNGPPSIQWKSYLADLWSPMRSNDFLWVWITRAFIMMGFYAVEPFLLYYVQDILRDPTPAKTTALIGAVILAGSTITGIVFGRISDRIGRKKIVYWACGSISAASLLLVFCKTLPEAASIAMVFGLAYGAYLSVDWALGTDVLPTKGEAGKDMGVWHVAMTLPQQIAPLATGLILEQFLLRGERVGNHTPTSPLGYTLVFLMAAVFFVGGGYFVKNVKKAQ